MCRADRLAAGEVGDGARDLLHAVQASARPAQPLGRELQQSATRVVERAVAFQAGHRQLGIGQALAIGFQKKDYPVLQVLIMMAALIYIVVNLLVDIAYAIIDPRVRTR